MNIRFYLVNFIWRQREGIDIPKIKGKHSGRPVLLKQWKDFILSRTPSTSLQKIPVKIKNQLEGKKYHEIFK
jgi:hypothetical protein